MPDAEYGIEPEEQTFDTAFLVGVRPDGTATVFLDHTTYLHTEREAESRDIRRACTEIASDLDAQRAAQYVMLMLKSVADKKAEAERPSAKVEQALKKRRRR